MGRWSSKGTDGSASPGVTPGTLSDAQMRDLNKRQGKADVSPQEYARLMDVHQETLRAWRRNGGSD